ncbi:MAG TPA: DUF4440 domain-containing protein [Pyrinomonadaceae bacterium]|nr:DUF4440 domain-containing protein [Pyrinomonadaceae bacterium]
MTRVSLLIILIALTSVVATQRQQQKSPIAEMVETERTFARASKDKGTTASFLEFIADDGILFRPRAVKGKEWLTANPPPASDKRPWLHWEPSFAFMSGSGEMGYTFGPWEYRSNIKDPEPVAFGHFLTVWKKQLDGSWKFAVDLGISHPKASSPAPQLQMTDRYQPASRAVSVNRERAALIAREKRMSAAGARQGQQVAFFVNNATSDVHLFRANKLPFVGHLAAMEILDPRPNAWTWEVEFADVTNSGDLGYSYGTYKLAALGVRPAESGNYLRIWRKERGVWKVAVDLANPIVDGKN